MCGNQTEKEWKNFKTLIQRMEAIAAKEEWLEKIIKSGSFGELGALMLIAIDTSEGRNPDSHYMKH